MPVDVLVKVSESLTRSVGAIRLAVNVPLLSPGAEAVIVALPGPCPVTVSVTAEEPAGMVTDAGTVAMPGSLLTS